MSIESKLNALLAAQAAQSTTLTVIATAVASIKEGDNSALETVLEHVEASVDAIQAELGTDTDPTAPVATPAP